MEKWGDGEKRPSLRSDETRMSGRIGEETVDNPTPLSGCLRIGLPFTVFHSPLRLKFVAAFTPRV